MSGISGDRFTVNSLTRFCCSERTPTMKKLPSPTASKTIRAWLPRGFVPPQVTIASAKPSTEVMMTRFLGTTEVHPQLSGDDVLYWRSDIF